MLVKAQSPYIDQLKAKYPAFTFYDHLPKGVRPEDISRVHYKAHSTEFVFKHQKKISVAVLSVNDGQKEIIRLKREIARREEYLDRVEDWECRDHEDLFSMDIQWRLIESRKTESDREFTEQAMALG